MEFATGMSLTSSANGLIKGRAMCYNIYVLMRVHVDDPRLYVTSEGHGGPLGDITNILFFTLI